MFLDTALKIYSQYLNEGLVSGKIYRRIIQGTVSGTHKSQKNAMKMWRHLKYGVLSQQMSALLQQKMQPILRLYTKSWSNCIHLHWKTLQLMNTANCCMYKKPHLNFKAQVHCNQPLQNGFLKVHKVW